MYAVVRIAGKQVRADKGLRIRVPRLGMDEGSRQRFTEVLLVSQESGTQVGRPLVDGAVVEATVVAHGRGEKIVVFKMKRRKKYRRRTGHRQDYTELQVEDIHLPN
jgi:large subunit ribosomal protein L21